MEGIPETEAAAFPVTVDFRKMQRFACLAGGRVGAWLGEAPPAYMNLLCVQQSLGWCIQGQQRGIPLSTESQLFLAVSSTSGSHCTK